MNRMTRLHRNATVLLFIGMVFPILVMAESPPSSELLDRWTAALKTVAEGLEQKEARNRGQAIELLTDAVRIKRELVETHPDNGEWQRVFCTTLDHLGDTVLMRVTLKSDNRHDTAIAHYREALGIRQRLLAQSPESGAALKDVSVSHSKIGIAMAYAKAPDADIRRQYQKSLNLRKKLAAAYPGLDEHLDLLVESHSQLIGLDRRKGDYTNAIKRNQEVLKILKKLARGRTNNKEAHHAIISSYQKMAKDYLQLNDKPAALESYEAALKLAEKRAILATEDNWPAQRVVQLRGEILGLTSKRPFQFDWPVPSVGLVHQTTRTNDFNAEVSYQIKLTRASGKNPKSPLVLGVSQVALKTVDDIKVDSNTPLSATVQAWKAHIDAPDVRVRRDGRIADFVDPLQVQQWMKAILKYTDPAALAKYEKIEPKLRSMAKETGIATTNPMTSWNLAKTSKGFWESGVAYWTGAEKYPLGSRYGTYVPWIVNTEKIRLYVEFVNHGETIAGSDEFRLSMTYDVTSQFVAETLEWARSMVAKGDNSAARIIKVLTNPATPVFIHIEAVVNPSTLLPTSASQVMQFRPGDGQKAGDGYAIRNEFQFDWEQ